MRKGIVTTYFERREGNMNTISNYCRFIGRLVKDPQLIQLENTELVTFTLAINEYRKEKGGDKKKTVNYFDFEAGDSGAATLGKYCKKGDIVEVVTSDKNKTWTDPEGNKRLQTRFRVKEFKLFNNGHHQKEEGEGNAEHSSLEADAAVTNGR